MTLYQVECQHNSACNYWTWDFTWHNACWMKTDKTQTSSNGNVISGPKYCGDPPPTTTSDPNGEQDSMRVSRNNFIVVIINITW